MFTFNLIASQKTTVLSYTSLPHKMHTSGYAIFTIAWSYLAAATTTCDPLNSKCNPNIGLHTPTFTIDFTKQSSLPANWTLAAYEKVSFGPLGAEFTYAKRYDAPQIWTDFYILFGKVEVVMQVAPGTSIISSSVLMSDDEDEIDWEFSGNNFGDITSSGKGQTNYFGKGITGDYDRATVFNVANPQHEFHTYTLDWTSTQLTWSIDGIVIRTLLEANSDDSTHQYPQTPSRLQLGLWDGGDASESSGTIKWAGGLTNLTELEEHPVTMYVKSVSITNYNPAYGYNYTDKSGRWQSIELLKRPPSADGTWSQTSSRSSSSTQKSTSSTHTSSSTKSTLHITLTKKQTTITKYSTTTSTKTSTITSQKPTTSSTKHSSPTPDNWWSWYTPTKAPVHPSPTPDDWWTWYGGGWVGRH